MPKPVAITEMIVVINLASGWIGRANDKCSRSLSFVARDRGYLQRVHLKLAPALDFLITISWFIVARLLPDSLFREIVLAGARAARPA